MLSTSLKSPEKLYKGLVAVGLIGSALIESEGMMTMIFADVHSLSPEDPSEKF